jgi:hypothetical protein
MERTMQEPKLQAIIRISSAVMFLSLSLLNLTVLPKSPSPLFVLILSIIPAVLACGLFRKLNWSRVPSEFMLAFIAFFCSSYFLPLPDEQQVPIIRQSLAGLPIFAFWAFHILIWSFFLGLAYIISNSRAYFVKTWW